MSASSSSPSRDRVVAAWREDAARLSARLNDPTLPREDQMDARRRLECLERTSQVLDELTQRDPRARLPRVVVAHRAEWFRRGVTERLAAVGLEVVAVEDGSRALAHVVVDQPDLVVLEDLLPWVTGPELIRATRSYAPHTTLVAVTEDPGSGEACLAAGATTRFSRFLPLEELCRDLVGLLSHAQVA